MELGTLMLIEFFAFFFGILAFGAHQLWSLKRLAEKDKAAEASGAAPRDDQAIPGWMARR